MKKPPYASWATPDTVYRFRVLQVPKDKGTKYAIWFRDTNLELPFVPRKPYVEITARELLLAFTRHNR